MKLILMLIHGIIVILLQDIESFFFKRIPKQQEIKLIKVFTFFVIWINTYFIPPWKPLRLVSRGFFLCLLQYISKWLLLLCNGFICRLGIYSQYCNQRNTFKVNHIIKKNVIFTRANVCDVAVYLLLFLDYIVGGLFAFGFINDFLDFSQKSSLKKNKNPCVRACVRVTPPPMA